MKKSLRLSLRRWVRWGTSLRHPDWLNQNIANANRIALLSAFFVFCLTIIHFPTHPDERVLPSVAIIATLLSIPLLNQFNQNKVARMLLVIALIGGSLALDITRKIYNPAIVTEVNFYLPRVAIIVFSIVPLIVFSLREKALLITNVILTLLALVLFDPIHNVLHVGFYDFGFKAQEYYYQNVIILIVYAILNGSFILFKTNLEDYQKRNELLISSLKSQNQLIQEQREELQSQSELLKKVVDEKDKDLATVTQQVIKINLDLQQYAHTLSHNMRGPVATLLGLIGLARQGETLQGDLIDKMSVTTSRLDQTIQELNKITAAKEDTFSIREEIFIKDEIDQIIQNFITSPHDLDIEVATDITTPSLYASRARVRFILSCLIKNAIQFRNPEKNAQVLIKTYRQEDYLVVEITDNGLGVDLKAYKDAVFKPFKVFHPTASGRGMGLYLVRLQVEKLHGKVEIQSTPGKGTTVTLFIKDWQS